MIPQEQISKAMSQGAPLTCATCRHYHVGEGLCHHDECGGPAKGLDFPSYNGLIPKDAFVQRCLVCGSPPAFLIMMGEDKARFSLCEEHEKIYDSVEAAPGKIVHPVKVIAILG